MIDVALLNLLPPLRRARGDRLYGPDQKHWVDLWKQDGAWLLGHRPEGAAQEWKNQIDKGLATWAPSLWPRRLETLVPRLLPSVTAVRVLRNADRAPKAALWRPWDRDQGLAPLVAGTATRLVLPTGPGQAVAVAWAGELPPDLPDHDVTSPAEASALVQAVAQVIRFENDPWAQATRAGACATFDSLLGPSGHFHRQGLWLTATQPDRYADLFRAHWDAGFFLNPDPFAPSLLPTSLSRGEWAAWQRVAEGLQGGKQWNS